MDEPVFFHKASGLIITGHHWEFTYAPKGYQRPEDQKAIGWAFRLMDSMFVVPGRYVSTYAAGTDERIGDPNIHAEQWQKAVVTTMCPIHVVQLTILPLWMERAV